MDSHSMPIISPPQMGVALPSDTDISSHSKDAATLALGRQSQPSVPGPMPCTSNMENTFLRLSNPQLFEQHCLSSSSHFRPMNGIIEACGDAHGPGVTIPSEGQMSITNNSDLLKAFTTMSAEQQTALLSNINSKLMHSGVHSPVQENQQRAAQNMNGFLPNQHPFPDQTLPIDVPPPPIPSSSSLSNGHGHASPGHFPSSQLDFSQYRKDQGFSGSLLGQGMDSRSVMTGALDQVHSSSPMLIDIPGQEQRVPHPGPSITTAVQDRIMPMFNTHCNRMSAGAEPQMDDPPPCTPPSKRLRLGEDQPKNPNRNMSGVPEWSQAEVDAVMRLYEERGRLPKWKPIADELSRMNVSGQLNPTLLQKGLIRSNNAVMNKVKEILYKEQGDVPGRYDGNGDVAPKRSTAGVPEWNEAEINTVLELWNKHGRQSEWKSISLELAALNHAGELNPELTAKGLQRTNNAVMNKVKELSGIARARRSRPRTVGNFALLPLEGKWAQPLGMRSMSDAGIPAPDPTRISGMMRDSSDGCSRMAMEGMHCCLAYDGTGLKGIRSMSVVSPVPTLCPPPVLIQMHEPAIPAPPVPQVSPVPHGGLHSSPVVQQDSSE